MTIVLMIMITTTSVKGISTFFIIAMDNSSLSQLLPLKLEVFRAKMLDSLAGRHTRHTEQN